MFKSGHWINPPLLVGELRLGNNVGTYSGPVGLAPDKTSVSVAITVCPEPLQPSN